MSYPYSKIGFLNEEEQTGVAWYTVDSNAIIRKTTMNGDDEFIDIDEIMNFEESALSDLRTCDATDIAQMEDCLKWLASRVGGRPTRPAPKK